MAIIVDTCAFVSVFSGKAKDHSEFKPVYWWILKGRGFLVVGGKTFLNELSKITSAISLLTELQRAGKVASADGTKVDGLEKKLKKLGLPKSFDDPHLVALVGVTGCRIVCTNDKKAIPFLKQANLYPKGCLEQCEGIGECQNLN